MAKYVVRFGTMRHLGVMSPRGGDGYSRGNQIIARTSRGLEVGEVLCEANEQTTSEIDESNSGQILRSMENDDFTELGRIGNGRTERFEKCLAHIKELSLDMQLVDIEQIFGGERIIVYYLAEQRVDFRELVKQLAAEFQTRIEMRQIGVRDEAKLLADYGDCGKPVCCNTHLSSMPPVSMKMAKIQKATLDPNKISGRCGRLKCCLRYEYDTYISLQREFPKMGSDVVTREGRGRVIGQELLAEQVLLEMEDHRRMLVDLRDILSVIAKPKKSPPKQNSSKPESNDARSKESTPKDAGPKVAGSSEARTGAAQSSQSGTSKPRSAEPKRAEPRRAEPKRAEPKRAEPKSNVVNESTSSEPESKATDAEPATPNPKQQASKKRTPKDPSSKDQPSKSNPRNRDASTNSERKPRPTNAADATGRDQKESGDSTQSPPQTDQTDQTSTDLTPPADERESET